MATIGLLNSLDVDGVGGIVNNNIKFNGLSILQKGFFCGRHCIFGIFIFI